MRTTGIYQPDELNALQNAFDEACEEYKLSKRAEAAGELARILFVAACRRQVDPVSPWIRASSLER